MGGDGLRSGGGDGAGGGERASGATSGATRIVCNHAGGGCDGPGMPGDAETGGKPGTTVSAGVFLCFDDDFYRADFREGFLSGQQRAAVVFCLPVFSGIRRRELRGVHVVAAGAIPYGMPSERVRVFHFVRAIHWGWNYVSGGSRRAALRLDRNAGGADWSCVRGWAAADAIG